MISKASSAKDQSGTDTQGREPNSDTIARIAAEISELAARSEPDFFELANALAAAQVEYSKAFAEIIKIAGVSRRRAYYFFEIRKRFQPFMHDTARLRAIGWTKLKVLGPYINAENADEMLAMAQMVSAHKLGQILRDGRTPVASHCILLRLTHEQYALYEAAILANGGQRRGRQLIDQERALLGIIDRASAHCK